MGGGNSKEGNDGRGENIDAEGGRERIEGLGGAAVLGLGPLVG